MNTLSQKKFRTHEIHHRNVHINKNLIPNLIGILLGSAFKSKLKRNKTLVIEFFTFTIEAMKN